MEKKPDRRTVRTKEFLQHALMQLIAEKGYEKISVQDIIKRANIGRSTFYTHFQDKEDLLVSGFEQLGQSGLFDRPDSHDQNSDIDPPFITLVPLLEHGKEQYHLYKMMSGTSGMDAILRQIQKQLTAGLTEKIEHLIVDRPRPKVPVDVMAHTLASSYLSLMTWWMENGMPHSAVEMDGMFQNLIMPGFWQQVGHPSIHPGSV